MGHPKMFNLIKTGFAKEITKHNTYSLLAVFLPMVVKLTEERLTTDVIIKIVHLTLDVLLTDIL